MTEEYFIEYSAPTLAGIKTANLFSCDYQDKSEVVKDIRRFNDILVKRGIRVIPVRYFHHRVLIYVYRPSFLTRDLCDENSSRLLERMGYDTSNTDKCVSKLCMKLSRLSSSSDFPHEVGLFLGYPPEDVRGFMEDPHSGYRCVGFWKVYGDVEKSQRCFERIRKCRQIYYKQWTMGKSVEHLTVSA